MINRKGKKHKLAAVIFSEIFVFLLLFIVFVIIKSGKLSGISIDEAVPPKNPLKKLGLQTSPVPSAKPETVNTAALQSLKLYSHNAVLISLNDEKILMEKKSDKTIYPASLTKIMTVITALDHIEDLDQKIVLPSDMFDRLYKDDASMAGFLPDEKVKAIDLLYGAMLPSGAECCIGLADFIAGSEDNFAELMNKKAGELGLEHTNFTNSTGLHDPQHYTTVKDLAMLLEYALKNETFRKIFTSAVYTTSPSSAHPDGITMYSTMFKNLDKNQLKSGEIIGGKTGYTSEAGLCLASLAKLDDREYILVTAGADGNHKTEQYNITDAITIYDRVSRN